LLPKTPKPHANNQGLIKHSSGISSPCFMQKLLESPSMQGRQYSGTEPEKSGRKATPVYF